MFMSWIRNVPEKIIHAAGKIPFLGKYLPGSRDNAAGRKADGSGDNAEGSAAEENRTLLKIAVNGQVLAYEKVGHGSPLIMVHGNGEDHTIFLEAAEKLSRYHTCYLVDSRGHGESSDCDDLNYEDMAEDMMDFITALNLKQVTFYGFSDGGIIGLIAAAKSNLIERLIISGANTKPEGVVTWLYLQFLGIYIFTKDPKMKLMLTQPHISDEMLESIHIPVLVMAGTKDIIRREHTDHIADTIPGSTLWILKGETHGSYIVHNDRIASLIMTWERKTGQKRL